MKTHEPPYAESKSKLVDAVIERIRSDIERRDEEALDELLRFVPRLNLIQYLDEEEWDKFLTADEKKKMQHPAFNYGFEIPEECPNEADCNSVRIGEFDADELRIMASSSQWKEMVRSGRIGLQFDSRDKGTIWVKEGDGKAFKVASTI